MSHHYWEAIGRDSPNLTDVVKCVLCGREGRYVSKNIARVLDPLSYGYKSREIDITNEPCPDIQEILIF